MKKHVLITTACAAMLMSCAPPAQPVGGQLGPDPVLSGGRYTSGGGLTVAATVSEAQGRTKVCGVWAKSRQQSILTKGVERRVMASGSVFLGDERIAQDLLFMREVAPRSSYAGAEAGCVLVARAWRAADAAAPVRVRIPRQMVANESDGNDVGPIVYFEQTGPAAGG